MTYGIGRIPQDVDVAAESIALAEAQAITSPRRAPDYPNGRRLDCGCVVHYSTQVMRANMGSSCCGCYDRMAD